MPVPKAKLKGKAKQYIWIDWQISLESDQDVHVTEVWFCRSDILSEKIAILSI